MNETVMLNELQLEEIRKLAKERRQSLGFVGEAPIANDIFTILDQLDIMLLEYLIESEKGKPAFSAAIMYSEEGEKELVFIGVNTADYYDKQIFAIAHELYHYYTKKGSHLTRLNDEESNIIEAKANRFAAEFLLSEENLKGIALENFKASSLKNISDKALLRFIARLHCTYWLPYHSLIKRLSEIRAITQNQMDHLYAIDERDLNSEYFKIGIAVNKEIFIKLNTITKITGTSAQNIEIILHNFEDNLIDEEKFADTLSLFNKIPEEFGYGTTISDEDIDELNAFFSQIKLIRKFILH
ncbi:ImmA/IrrE family metallo-endopeptidase [Carnobacterium sp.]|uniref:ImmA/IrrE family metallo-endopeptidase n=1 Tax=Carnobacterium sp. TaxID=48221 RepID=UPI0028A62A6E|nr:ImmA/IrrE family metallo-endopeptidase [Carnobacterium sp.]